MKLDQHEQPNVLSRDLNREEIKAEPRPSSRRDFLQKSSATVLISSLAAQPVWGRCTVSGAMSGGSATRAEDEDPCILPEVYGRPPTFWTSSAQNEGMLLSAFPLVGESEAEALGCYIAQIVAESVFLVPETPEIPAEMVNVGDALAAGGAIHSHLATVWLNAHFGFFENIPLPGRDESNPQEWVDHFFALSKRAGEGWGDDFVFSAIYTGDAATQWSSLPAGYTCA